ncbi:response regulator transcription factor [Marinibacterium profundimaris]|uniref:Transcriptional regulator n=1 Tax=Marinibacterium profundimaris TaxID=1679460 RepID=A0A225P196_9RHOB|nr:response regulator transcription factor [Marinibacterium profundimaris]OWU77956.1 hypothetical protein ATO3_04820 [Marinibacterium profundimaris]
MRSIMLVDHDRSALQALSQLLEGEGYHVETFVDPTLALRSLRRLRPDMAVMDMRIPRVDGLELLAQIRAQSDLPVMVMTSRASELEEAMGLRMGADDYVAKPFSPRVMVERIGALVRRHKGELTRPGDKVLEVGPLVIDPNRHWALWRDHPLDLSATEFRLFTYLAEAPGYIRTREQIMKRVYGDRICVEDRTVDSHIKRLRTKLKAVDPACKAIETVYGVGYRLTLPED